MKLVSIIIPCHNEQDNIINSYQELNKVLTNNEQISYEYIFVDDGSTDQTVAEVKRIATDKRVKLVSFSRNFGKEQAMIAGLDYSTGDAAVIIDADLQMPVSYINQFILDWQAGFKLVLSVRSNRSNSLKAKLASKYYQVYNKMTDDKILKDALDFQLMDRTVIDEICKMREANRYFKGMTGYIGYNYKLVEVEMRDRTSGESDFGSFRSLFNYALKSFIITSTMPLKISIIGGMLTSLGAFIYMLVIIITTLTNGVEVPGYSSLTVIVLFGFGIMYILIGIVGLYIGNIYQETKQRPLYIVEQKLNL